MEYNLKIILFLFILLLYYYNNYDSNFIEGYREGDYIDFYTKLLKLDSLNSLDPTRKFDLSFYNYFTIVNEDSVDEYRQIAKENLGSSEERRDDPLLIVVTQEDLETLLWGTSGKGRGTIQCTWWQAQCIPLLQVAIEELKLKPQDFKRPKKVKKDELKDYDQEDYIEALSKDSLDNEIITLYRINLVKLNKLDDDTNYKAVFTSLNQDLNQALSEEMNFDFDSDEYIEKVQALSLDEDYHESFEAHVTELPYDKSIYNGFIKASNFLKSNPKIMSTGKSIVHQFKQGEYEDIKNFVEEIC